MKRKTTPYKRKTKRDKAKRKTILATAKNAFTPPKRGGGNNKYVFFEEKTGTYLSLYPLSSCAKQFRDRTGKAFWTTGNVGWATIFKKGSGINSVIPFMPFGAWQIIKIKI